MQIEEGKIPVESGYEVWYRRVGGGAIPLLTLHGGPGAGHDYLEPLEGLAADRTVIFYDQLGCGKSDQPDDRALWVMERFVTEVDAVRHSLGLKQIHLFGHSWGGWLAIEYMLGRPSGVVSLILASTSAGVPQFVREARRLKLELPREVLRTIERYEGAGDYGNPEYEEAAGEFYRRHVCRLSEWPEPLERTGANLDGNPVYETMNGPNEFTVIGNLKDWDRTGRLHEITLPTLITVGRYDELTPACAETLLDGIPESRIVLFEDSAHVAHLEESEKYLRVLTDFMAGVEARDP